MLGPNEMNEKFLTRLYSRCNCYRAQRRNHVYADKHRVACTKTCQRECENDQIHSFIINKAHQREGEKWKMQENERPTSHLFACCPRLHFCIRVQLNLYSAEIQYVCVKHGYFLI